MKRFISILLLVVVLCAPLSSSVVLVHADIQKHLLDEAKKYIPMYDLAEDMKQIKQLADGTLIYIGWDYEILKSVHLYATCDNTGQLDLVLGGADSIEFDITSDEFSVGINGGDKNATDPTEFLKRFYDLYTHLIEAEITDEAYNPISEDEVKEMFNGIKLYNASAGLLGWGKNQKLEDFLGDVANVWATKYNKQMSRDANKALASWINDTGYCGKNSKFTKAYKKLTTKTTKIKMTAADSQDNYDQYFTDLFTDLYQANNIGPMYAIAHGVTRYMGYSDKWYQDVTGVPMQDDSAFDTSNRYIMYIRAICAIEDSNYSISVDKKFSYDKDDIINLAVEERHNMMNKLEEAVNNSTEESLPLDTFAVRVRYLVNSVECDDKINQILYDITKSDVIEYRFPAVPFITPNGGEAQNPFRNKVDIVNQDAYELLLNTLAEAWYYRDMILTSIDIDIKESKLSEVQKQIKLLNTLYEAVNYINCSEMWYLWNYPDANDVTLADMYSALLKLDAFKDFDSYEPSNKDDPLSVFFDSGDKVLSNGILTGMAESAKYLALQTNVYDPYTVRSCTDKDFTATDGFHYKYGYYRKALFLDTTANAAVHYFNTAAKGNLRVCTLKDLIDPINDVVLYIDDNFYNADRLSDLQDEAFGSIEADKDKVKESIWETATDIASTKVDKLLKNGTQLQYARDVAEDSSIILSSKLTKKNIEASEYDVLQPFAVVSAIYKDTDLLNQENDMSKNARPVFMASNAVAQLAESETYNKNTLLNWALLQNLKANMAIDYTSNIDMSSPVYMDIYGNILTESGTVIVPAAANATLHTADYFPASASFVSYYGDEWKIPTSYKNVDSILKDSFTQSEETESWELNSTIIDGVANMAMLSIADTSSLEALRKLYAYDLNNKVYDFELMSHIILEVLRGAPIEEIDDAKEGIAVSGTYDKTGIQATAKLEQLNDALGVSDTNAVLSIPNLSFSEDVQYIAAFVFKVCVIFCVIIMLLTIYTDIVSTRLSIRTFFKCLVLPGFLVLAIISVPVIFDVTYYQSNKMLLQNETEYIAMLNQEKRASGKEIGVYEIDKPDLSTKLYLKLLNTDVNWYDVFSRVFFSNIGEELEDVYQEYTEDNFISEYDIVETKNGGVYVSLDNLFDSADVTFLSDFHTLHMTVNQDPIVSFYSPFYMILDSLIYKVNKWNTENNVFSYATTLHSGGEIKTLGLCKNYFESEDFLEGEGDFLGLYYIYNVTPDMITDCIFSSDELTAMMESQWVNMNMPDEDVVERSYKIYDRAKDFIAENRNLLGRVSDDTFLKVMALDLATYYNSLFGIMHANSIDIMNLSNDDLLRLATAPKEVVMEYSTMSYPRFVWEVGGTPAVIAAALMSCTNFVGNYVKPIACLLAWIIIFCSLFINKIVLRKRDYQITGFLATLGLLALSNIIYALLLKLTVTLPQRLSVPSAASLLIQCLMQLVYLNILCNIVIYTIKDFKGLGADKFNYVFDKVIVRRMNNSPAESAANRRAKDGKEYYDELVARQEQRTGGSLVTETTRIKGAST